MKYLRVCVALIAVIWASGSAVTGQQTPASSTSAPTLVRLDGQLKTEAGDARTGSVTLVVSLYAEKDDTTPLWVEQQPVTLDGAGRYTIYAGSTLPDGVPQEFLSGATPGRWVGVGVQGEAEQFRMMLVTVPYAAKAREADTLAGKSATDFVLTSSVTDTVKAAIKASGVGLAGGTSTDGTGPGVSGTLNVIQKGAGGAAIADSTGFVEVGGNVGIGTASPGAALDIDKSSTGSTAILVRNPMPGPVNWARLDIKTDSGGGRGLFDAYSSTFTTDHNSVQSGVSFTAIGAGGFSIALQDPAAPMRFYTGPGPTEQMRITSIGNVGIGTTTPTTKLVVVADGHALLASSNTGAGVFGYSFTNYGVHGASNQNTGVFGEASNGGVGVKGSGAVGVEGIGTNYGVYGNSQNGEGVLGTSNTDIGVTGISGRIGVFGQSGSVGSGIEAVNLSTSGFGDGLKTTTSSPDAVGLWARNLGANGTAGRFDGNVVVYGALTKSSGSFKIDHPLDPENKYLYHSFVESPDMMNIYNGNVITDANGDADVTMPDWFEALNRDFRYQLTCIGAFAQAIVAEEVVNNHFKIKTSVPNVKVSWQVTGVRQDAWARQHRVPVEEDKPAAERGLYLHPEVFDQPVENSVQAARETAIQNQRKAALELNPGVNRR